MLRKTAGSKKLSNYTQDSRIISQPSAEELRDLHLALATRDNGSVSELLGAAVVSRVPKGVRDNTFWAASITLFGVRKEFQKQGIGTHAPTSQRTSNAHASASNAHGPALSAHAPASSAHKRAYAGLQPARDEPRLAHSLRVHVCEI